MPPEKLVSRFPRTLGNLKAAIRDLPYVLILDNDDLRIPFRRVAMFERGQQIWAGDSIPKWLEQLVRR